MSGSANTYYQSSFPRGNEDSTEYEVDDDVSIGFNSLLSMSIDQTAAYFGGEARDLFNQRYQMLCRQRKIVAKSGKETVLSSYFSGANRDQDYETTGSSFLRRNKYGLLQQHRQKKSGIKLASVTTVRCTSDDSEVDDGVSFTQEYKPITSTIDSRKNSQGTNTHSVDDDSGIDDDVGTDIDDDDADEVSSTDSFMSELADNDYDAAAIAQPLSPRSRFISSCIREGLNPRASLVLRKRISTHLKLSHLSIGDKVACILAESLVDLPDVESIDIEDNVLSDLSLVPFLKAISTISSLKELNLSSNIIGPKAAKAISTYLSCPSCPLRRLILQKADVDDYECERFITSIQDNSTLTEIDLSGNKIGSAEALNTVKPDLVTGGEAIAALLRSPKTKLEILKLGWNMIRLSSAVELGNSLSVNATLLYLDLSCNSLGKDGGEAIGEAVLNNRTLQTLILSSNGIESRACFTICMGIIENFSLKKVCLDGNPIGVQGAKALMTISMEAGDRVEVTSQGCNIVVKDPNSWFDYSRPYGPYSLDMACSYDRAVAFALLRLTASHQRIIFTESSFEGAELNLVQVLSPIEPLMSDANPKGLSHLESLENIKHLLFRKGYAASLFKKADTEQRGFINVSGVQQALQVIGFDFNSKICEGLMSKFDIDKSGVIDLKEFQELLEHRAAEVVVRIKNLSGQLIMTQRPTKIKESEIQSRTQSRAATADMSDISMLNHENGRQLSSGVLDVFIPRYVPPSKGLLHLKVSDSQTIKSLYKVMTQRDQQHILKAAKESGHAASMMCHAVENTKVHLAGAISLYETMHKETGKMATILLQVMPLLQNPSDARELLLYVTDGDRMAMGHIKQVIGYALKPLCGMYDGYYCLNLVQEASQLCIRRLLEVSESLRTQQMALSPIGGPGRVGDTSQKGNWSCFRNEILNHTMCFPLTIKAVVPKRGVLEFDFMGSSRPPPPLGATKLNAVTSSRLFGVLERCKLMIPRDRAEALRYLHKCREDGNRVVRGTGASIFENTEKRAKGIGEAMARFQASLHLRKHCNEQAALNEVVKIDYEKDRPSSKASSRPVSHRRVSLIPALPPERDFVPRAGTPGRTSSRVTTPGVSGNLGRVGSPGLPSNLTGSSSRVGSPPGLPVKTTTLKPVGMGMSGKGKAKKKRPLKNSFLNNSELDAVAFALSVSACPMPPISPLKPFSMFANSPHFSEVVQFHPFSPTCKGIIAALTLQDKVNHEESNRILHRLPEGRFQASFPPGTFSSHSGPRDDSVEGRCGIPATEGAESKIPVSSAAGSSSIRRSSAVFAGGMPFPHKPLSAALPTLSQILETSPRLSSSLGPTPSITPTRIVTPTPTGYNTPSGVRTPTGADTPGHFPPGTSNSSSQKSSFLPSISNARKRSTTLGGQSIRAGVTRQKSEKNIKGLLTQKLIDSRLNEKSKEFRELAIAQDLQKFLHSSSVALVSKAARLLSYLEEKLSQVWLKARHLALILRMFEEIGSIEKTEFFGTYRVDLVVTMFSRILDLHNLEIVLHCLTPFEVGCLYMKIGWLKLYNPLKPEGAYILDIGRSWEERQVVKMLCGLEVHEPGENWMSYSFRWDADGEVMPGWTLTQPWLSNDGMSNRGVLCVRYYCGDGMGYYGCKAHTIYRRALCSMVLIDESEAVEDHDDDSNEGSGNSTPVPVTQSRTSRRICYPGLSTLFQDAEGFGMPTEEAAKKSTYTQSVPGSPAELLKEALHRLNGSEGGTSMKGTRSGEKYMVDNPTQWLEYFYPKP